MDYLKVTYRQIAKMLCSALPVQNEDFTLKVEEYLTAIKAMPIEAKNALKVAYVFSRKVPREEREDLFQDIALAVLKAKAKDEKLAYAIARMDWLDWWRRYSIRQHTSLDSVINDTEGNSTTLGELIVGAVQFEHMVDGKIEAERLWSKIPDNIKPLVLKRLEGKPLISERRRGRPATGVILNDTERKRFSRWLKSDGYKLALA